MTTARITLLLLLLAGSVFALGGCFGGGREETTTITTTGGETISARTIGGETTAARRSGEVTIAKVAFTNLMLTPSEGSEVSGNARITDTPGGVNVDLDMQGLMTEPGTEHAAHIHEGGTCADERADNGAPVLYSLDPLVAQSDGTASSASLLEGVNLRELTSGAPKYVNVHDERTGEAVPPSIACADIPGAGG